MLKKKQKKKGKIEHVHEGCCEEENNLDHLYDDNRTQITKVLLDEGEDNEEEIITTKKGKKKNLFRMQNGWLPPSDYRSYQ